MSVLRPRVTVNHSAIHSQTPDIVLGNRDLQLKITDLNPSETLGNLCCHEVIKSVPFIFSINIWPR